MDLSPGSTAQEVARFGPLASTEVDVFRGRRSPPCRHERRSDHAADAESPCSTSDTPAQPAKNVLCIHALNTALETADFLPQCGTAHSMEEALPAGQTNARRCQFRLRHQRRPRHPPSRSHDRSAPTRCRNGPARTSTSASPPKSPTPRAWPPRRSPIRSSSRAITSPSTMRATRPHPRGRACPCVTTA